jgi:phage terminase Nu1 subunit (DNA packaging protein)
MDVVRLTWKTGAWSWSRFGNAIRSDVDMLPCTMRQEKPQFVSKELLRLSYEIHKKFHLTLKLFVKIF